MKLSALVFGGVVALSTPIFAAPQKRAACTTPSVRKDWHRATEAERTSYKNAVLCLATKPSRLGHNTTLYDDFTWTHSAQTPRVHGVASFLPWHRYFIQLYEDALKDCGYSGSLMYWDWETASNTYHDIRDDPIWLPSGVGGNGVVTDDETARCVTDGPFASLRPAWYRSRYAPKCLTRQWTPPDDISSDPRWMNARWYTTAFMDGIRSSSTYQFFRSGLEGRGHSHVHGGVGGDMEPMDSSPNDPLFFLHHTQVDRIWWHWQQEDPANRTFDYGGWEGSGGVPQGNLSHPLNMSGFAPNRVVRDYMSSQSELQCFTYQT